MTSTGEHNRKGSEVKNGDSARASGPNGPSLDELRQRFQTDSDGLSSDRAKQLVQKYGPNELEESKQGPVLKFLSHFLGPIPWMIEIAIVLSAIVHHWADLIVIGVLLFANATVGFWEGFQAGNTIDALKKKLAPRRVSGGTECGRSWRRASWFLVT